MNSTMVRGSELDSFLFKFKHLLSAGYEAKMCFDASNGRARVSLDVDLGCLDYSSGLSFKFTS